MLLAVRIVIAPDSFKGSPDAGRAAAALAARARAAGVPCLAEPERVLADLAARVVLHL
jgi:hypothetical protein